MRVECLKPGLWTVFSLLVLSLSFTACQDHLEDLTSTPEAISSLSQKNATIDQDLITGDHSQGGKWLISLPDNWNEMPSRQLLVYAHGYVNVNEPVELPDDQIDGIPLKQIINSQGWAYATTSYRSNGLVVKDAIDDILELRDIVDNYLDGTHGFLPPHKIYLGGVSEGGLIGTLIMEGHPHSFDGALMTCCPIGNFYKQLQYYGNFHVLFNYFFKDELSALAIDLGDPSGVPTQTETGWIEETIQPQILSILTLNPSKVEKLIKTAKVKVDITNTQSVGEAILSLLEFNVMRTNDAIDKLGGSPFNNQDPKKRYWGSGDDMKLNNEIQRIKTPEWSIAKAEIDNYYETTGDITDPMVTMHTTGDHISLYSNQLQYQLKIINSGKALMYFHIPVIGYGHCSFTKDEVISALTMMVFRVELQDIEIPLASHESHIR